ncbi:hypothetical protein, partial [Roseateles sp.]|uniref:hypothetical protein n=1 Tax=Roseateles sp. TaxID=1971397 RepID=UPI003BA72305
MTGRERRCDTPRGLDSDQPGLIFRLLPKFSGGFHMSSILKRGALAATVLTATLTLSGCGYN